MKRLRKVKRVLAVLLTLALVITLSGITKDVAYAADPPFSITISNSANDDGTHTYEAYEVFSVSLNASGEPVVNGWGAGVNGDALLDSLKNDTTIGSLFATANSALDVATILTNNITVFASDTAANADFDTETKAFVKVIAANLTTTVAGTSVNNVISGLPVGYYFVQDANAPGPANPTTGDNNGAYTRFILQLATDANISISSKSDAPKLVIKVKEDSSSTDEGYGAGYNDVADYAVGDEVPYELIATLPTNTSAYDTYKVVFNDTLDTVLENPKDFVVTINGTPIDSSKYTVSDTSTGTFTITIDDIFDATGVTDKTTLDGADIVVKYTATLTDDAVPGTGYENTVTLTYSNDPNDSDSSSTKTGLTPPDEVIVFTYAQDFTKVDSVNEAIKLEDAKFVLCKGTGASKMYATLDSNGKITGWVAALANATKISSKADGTFRISGLDSADTYYLHETDAPSGYAIPDNDVSFTINSDVIFTQTWDGTVDGAKKTTGGNATAFIGDNINITNTKLTATLPTTGGIGTTVFYVVGTILIIGAGILLITRKRAKNQ